ncbi:hypothetical protein JA9_004608 [Meyerozyma sp. JA9]|nr:hypothetical protein JA9_004608 [Meyerozyma sp. JA9]
MTQTGCQNISQLPSPDAVRNKRPEFELPMLLLAAIRSDKWNAKSPGYLVFTDLTPNRSTTVAGGKLPPGIPSEFRLKDDMMDGLLNIDEVFTVNVSCTKFPKVVSFLQQSAPQIIDRYDFKHIDSCNMASEGLVALVKFSLKYYDGCIEALYSGIRLIDSNNARLLFPPGNLRLQELLNRFNARSYIGVVEKLKQNLGMDPTSLRRQVKTEKVSPVRPDRRPNVSGTALLFQNVTEESSDESSQNESYTQASAPSPQPIQASQQPSHIIESQKRRPSADEPPRKRPQPQVRDTQPNGVYSSHCTLASLPPLPATMLELRRQLVFSVEMTVLGMFPQGPFVIKPFNRTLKVAPLKLIVRDSTKQLELEFNTPREICALVGCTEVEELYNLQFSKLQALNRLSGTTRTFRMTVGYMKHRTGLFRSYWTGVMVQKTNP